MTRSTAPKACQNFFLFLSRHHNTLTLCFVLFCCFHPSCFFYSIDEELAFCKSMACLLTQTRDLPRLCHSYPTVVRSVGNGGGGGGGEDDTTASDNSSYGGAMTSLDGDSFHSNHYNQTIIPATTTTTHLGTSSAVSSAASASGSVSSAAFASSYHPIGFAAAGSVSFNSDTSDVTTTTSSSGFPYYESIPPHSDR